MIHIYKLISFLSHQLRFLNLSSIRFNSTDFNHFKWLNNVGMLKDEAKVHVGYLLPVLLRAGRILQIKFQTDQKEQLG